jgi:hypothetical protein
MTPITGEYLDALTERVEMRLTGLLFAWRVLARSKI